MLTVVGLQLSAFELFSTAFPISLGKTRVSRQDFNARSTDQVLKKIKKAGSLPPLSEEGKGSRRLLTHLSQLRFLKLLLSKSESILLPIRAKPAAAGYQAFTRLQA